MLVTMLEPSSPFLNALRAFHAIGVGVRRLVLVSVIAILIALAFVSTVHGTFACYRMRNANGFLE